MRNIFIIIILALCLAGCQKCKDKDKDKDKVPSYNCSIPKMLYDYGYFLPGTYWVYQDSATGVLDSVYVTYANKGVYNVKPEDNVGYQGTFGWYDCEMTSSYDHHLYKHTVNQTHNLYGDNTTIDREKYATTNSDDNTGDTYLMADVQIGKILYVYPDHVQYQNFYNSALVNTYTFSNVQLWFNSKSAIDHKQNVKYFISKNIGIVKKMILDSSQTWNLLRYHINQ